MDEITLRAHFDGEKIVLDETADLQPDEELLVIRASLVGDALEREDWLRLSAQRLAQAYGDDEPEYTLDMLKERNPDYEGR